MGISFIGTIRPSQRGIIERFGKYHRFVEPGLVWLIPIVDDLTKVNVTEQMVDAGGQEVITKDSLNAGVDAQVYFKIKPDEDSVKKSQYAVYNAPAQIVALTRTTLRDIIGNMTLTDANSKRTVLNTQLEKSLSEQIGAWGIQVVRAELKEINPPDKVQETMNKVVIAEKEKIAAQDFAIAKQTEADGERMAAVKKAEGQATAIIALANAKATEIKVVNEAAQTHFKGAAVELKRLEVAESTMKNNTKIIVPANSSVVNVLGDLFGTGKGKEGS